MSDDKHKEKAAKGKFCAVRTDKCDCPSGPNDYKANANGKESWSSESFRRRIKRKTGIIEFDKKPEAHHLLCIGSVVGYIYGDPRIDASVRETQWCINDKPNMIPMPLWGHTVQHYSNFTAGIAGVVAALKGSDELETTDPPGFQNWPQHDVDHNGSLSYKWEVDENLKKLANVIDKKQKTKDHELTPAQIKDALDKLSAKWEKMLRKRGQGTHDAWKKGQEEPTSDWYKPFSMAAPANAEKRTFPGRFDNRILAWMKRLAEAMS